MKTHYIILMVVALTACNTQPINPVQTEKSGPPADLWAGMTAPEGEQKETFSFERAPGPIPKPRVRNTALFGQAIAPNKPDGPAAKALKVVRTQPDGQIGLMMAASVTFNQPMVPLASVGDLKKEDAPLQLEPMPPGRFRWVGTQTLMFEAKDRFPFSTHYKATVPAGATTPSGQKLNEAVVFEFETPRLKVEASWPRSGSNQLKPDTPIVLSFNQRIDPQAMLSHIELKSNNGEPIDLKLIKDVPKDTPGSLHTRPADRTMALRPVVPLPRATTFTLTIRKTAPSPEGPLTAGSPWSMGFSTYGEMKPIAMTCGWSNAMNTCPHPGHIRVQFSNPIQPGPGLVDKITIKPAVTGEITAAASGNQIAINGAFKPKQTYTITVSKGIDDIYKQTSTTPISSKVTVADMLPAVSLGAKRMALLESDGPRLFPVSVTNLDKFTVQAAKLDPRNLHQALQHTNRAYHWKWKPFEPDYLKIEMNQTFEPGLERNTPGRVGIPLDELLGKGNTSGLVYMVVRAPQFDRGDRKHHLPIIVQVTDIGLAVRYDHDDVYVLATRLSDGSPVSNAELALWDRESNAIWTAKTNAEGFARQPGLRTIRDKGIGAYVLTATLGTDTASVVLGGQSTHGYLWAYNGGQAPPKQKLVTHVSTDRNIYRPGETVHFKGTMRLVGSDTGVNPLPAGVNKITYTLRDSRGSELLKDEEIAVSQFGTFSMTYTLPDDIPLGALSLIGNPMNLPAGLHHAFNHGVTIDEYRAPEFEVSASLSPKHLQFGQQLTGTASARYLFGAPMREAPVQWSLQSTPTSFTPPDQKGFQFGSTRQHTFGFRGRHGWGGHSSHSPKVLAEGTVLLDGQGRAPIHHTLERPAQKGKSNAPLQPRRVTLNVTVTDQNRQAISGQASVMVHPAQFYTGVKLDRGMYKEGDTVTINALAVSPDGERQIGVAMTASVVQSVMERKLVQDLGGNYRYEYASQEKEIGKCDITSAAEPVPCKVKVKGVGYFLARVASKDKANNPVRSDIGFYVSGKGYVPWRQDQGFKVELIADKPNYAKGDTARIMVKSPFERARGLLTLERDGVVEHRVLTIEGSVSAIDIPLKEEWLPGVTVALTLVRGRVKVDGVNSEGQDIGRPAFAHGALLLTIDTVSKRLNVAVAPSAEAISPGETLTVDLEVTDALGKGQETEVALFVVDEGVLSLLGYSTPDPLPSFHHPWAAGTALEALHNYLIQREENLKAGALKRNQAKRPAGRRANLGLESGTASTGKFDGLISDLEGLEEKSKRLKGEVFRSKARLELLESTVLGGAIDGNISAGRFAGTAIQARTNFLTTAYTNMSILTDAQGKARVSFKMPDNLTTYRLMAIAVSRKDKFGSGESKIRIRKPLLLRPALPRFASWGDRFEAGVVITNETGKEITATVGLRGALFERETPSDRQEVALKAGETSEVRFPVKVTESGKATFQFVVRAGTFSDAAEATIPVYIPVTTEAFATYGTTEESVAQPVKVPAGVIPSWGGLEIAMSSTALTGLEDAARYLHTYRYGCLEQTSSRLLPLVALGPILDDFKIDTLHSKEDRTKAASAMVTRIVKMQRPNGGFAFWPGANEASPYPTVYALWTLQMAADAGMSVPKNTLDRGASYLQHQLKREVQRWGPWYGLSTRAHAAFVLRLMKKPTTADELKALYSKKDRLPMFSIFHLLGAMHLSKDLDRRDWNTEITELRRLIDNSVVEQASTVHFSDRREEQLGLLMHSNTRTDAIGLYVLLKVAPKDPIIPKVIKGLMDARQASGTWGNTQENAIIIKAMADYYAIYEKTTPDYTAQIWYGDGYLGKEDFKGRSTSVAESLIPMNFLTEAGDRDILLAKTGPGRLYYRLGLRYAPSNRKVPAESQGFTVERTYAPADGEPNDSVSRTDEGWKIKAGTNIKVKLTIVVNDRSYHVAVDDPLPAGLEAVNTNYKTTNATLAAANNTGTVREGGYGWWWGGGAFQHTEQRDERVILFANNLPAGVYQHTYIARATTLGTFILPALKAEQMYAPEVFGRTATQMVAVVP